MGAADIALAGTDHCLNIVGDLLGGFKILIVHPIVLILTVVGGVFATDLGPRGVNAAAIIGLQVFASGMYEQVPGAILDEHGGVIVQQEPADVFEIGSFGRLVDRQRKVTAALGRTMFTKNHPGRDFFAARLRTHHSIGQNSSGHAWISWVKITKATQFGQR